MSSSWCVDGCLGLSCRKEVLKVWKHNTIFLGQRLTCLQVNPHQVPCPNWSTGSLPCSQQVGICHLEGHNSGNINQCIGDCVVDQLDQRFHHAHQWWLRHWNRGRVDILQSFCFSCAVLPSHSHPTVCFQKGRGPLFLTIVLKLLFCLVLYCHHHVLPSVTSTVVAHSNGLGYFWKRQSQEKADRRATRGGKELKKITVARKGKRSPPWTW